MTIITTSIASPATDTPIARPSTVNDDVTAAGALADTSSVFVVGDWEIMEMSSV